MSSSWAKCFSAIRSSCKNPARNLHLARRHRSKLDYVEFDDTSQKTTVELESRSESRHPLMLTGYTKGGFQFGSVYVRGPLAVVDKAIFRWHVTDPRDVDFDSLTLFQMLFPKVDLVIVGTGDRYVPIAANAIAEMKSRGVGVEVQATHNACGTYNLLKAERPSAVAAALLPITFYPHQKFIPTGQRYGAE